MQPNANISTRFPIATDKFSEAVALCETLSNLDRTDTSNKYRAMTALRQNLDLLFPADRRDAIIQEAPGGRDQAGHAVRYLRSMGWRELGSLLKNGYLGFPDLHGMASSTLLPEDQSKLKSLIQEIECPGALTYLEATYLTATKVPLDLVLNNHAQGRGGAQVFSPFLSTTTGGPMTSPVYAGVSVEMFIPSPRAFPNWGNFSNIEQESLVSEIRISDISRIYTKEDTLMDDLLKPDSQLAEILPAAFEEEREFDPRYNRYSNNAIVCWRRCERNLLWAEQWQSPEKIEQNKQFLREAYEAWGRRGLEALGRGEVTRLNFSEF